MATGPNVYTDEPAYAVLAHSLLAPESRTQVQEQPHSNTSNQNDWNLKDDWDAGIRTSSTAIFRCGIVIGFSRLRNRNMENDGQVSELATCHTGIHSHDTRSRATFS